MGVQNWELANSRTGDDWNEMKRFVIDANAIRDQLSDRKTIASQAPIAGASLDTRSASAGVVAVSNGQPRRKT